MWGFFFFFLFLYADVLETGAKFGAAMRVPATVRRPVAQQARSRIITSYDS